MKNKKTKSERREEKQRNKRKMKIEGASVKKLRELSSRSKKKQ